MDTNRFHGRLIWQAARRLLPVWIAALLVASCNQETTTQSAPDGSWVAAPRILYGELTSSQLAQATWVRVEASRGGTVLAFAESAYDVGYVSLKIPSQGSVDFTITGYSNQSKSVIVWTGTGQIASGTADPGLGAVTLAAGPGLILDVVATPTFSPDSGTYTSAQSVSLSSTTSGASIYYTTNGSTPKISSTPYTGAIPVGATQTIKAIAVKSGMTTSAVGSATYTINLPDSVVATPTFSPDSGTYTSAQTVSLSSTTSGASIYFTTNGSTPTISSTLYTSAIYLGVSRTIKAIAVKAGMTTSDVASATYTISTSGGASTIPWQSGISYGSVTWAGQTYKTVTIGTQTWMAENLNYAGPSGTTGLCPAITQSGAVDSCAKYGRLYTWAQTMDLPASCNNSSCDLQVTLPHQGICPTGWHVPTEAEWQLLEMALGMDSLITPSYGFRGTTEGTKLKSMYGWKSSGNGTDIYGFRALPSGYRSIGNTASDIGNAGNWWSATERDEFEAWNRIMGKDSANVGRFRSSKSFYYSLRCAKD